MYQLTIRQEGGAKIIQRLCEHTRERTANKAIWRAVRLFPSRCEELDATRRELAQARAELQALQDKVLDFGVAQAQLMATVAQDLRDVMNDTD